MHYDEAVKRFMVYARHEKGYSPHTLRGYTLDLKQFREFLITMGILSGEDTKAADGESMERIDQGLVRSHLAILQNKGLGRRSANRKLSSLNCLFRFCVRRGFLPKSPTLGIRYPRFPTRLPEQLTVEDVKTLLDSQTGEDFLQIRNHLILELLYGTGIRVSELCGINDEDFDPSERTLRIRGKGRKERVVLFGVVLGPIVKEYLENRAHYLAALSRRPDRSEVRPFFVNFRGGRLTPRAVEFILKKATNEAGLHRHITPHVLRHAFATHLLESGGDLRGISDLLGHENLSTTQKYTHLDVMQLMKVYDQAHPRAKE